MAEQALIDRLKRYSIKCLTERTDGDFAEAVWEAVEVIDGLLNDLQDALDRIAELTDTNVGKWVPVTDRLPEVGKSVLVISYGRVCFAKLLLTENNGGFPTFVLQDGLNNPPVLETTAHNEFTENRITHWMPLPEPPKDGGT